MISSAVATLPFDCHIAAIDELTQPITSTLDVYRRIKFDIGRRFEGIFSAATPAGNLDIRIIEALQQQCGLLGKLAQLVGRYFRELVERGLQRLSTNKGIRPCVRFSGIRMDTVTHELLPDAEDFDLAGLRRVRSRNRDFYTEVPLR